MVRIISAQTSPNIDLNTESEGVAQFHFIQSNLRQLEKSKFASLRIGASLGVPLLCNPARDREPHGRIETCVVAHCRILHEVIVATCEESIELASQPETERI